MNYATAIRPSTFSKNGLEVRGTPAHGTAAAANPRLPHPPARLHLPLSPAERGPSPRNAPPAVVLHTPKRNAREQARVGGGAGGQLAAKGRGDLQPAHAQIRVPARLPTVGTAMPRSLAAAASPGPAGTARGRELRPQVAPRPGSLFLGRPLTGG
ncbi:uncharacterized protein LOC126956109 [Macaca thibetana thibetana]|uniref:uncharacterized protein LOC126956109 n=1 Tax=Macaca thibetana thibetana TaxID=257877 RepID=UPI0021BC4919|nr:uncharacterized protein LOC126956109 [Macaca thibetana thibetana]